MLVGELITWAFFIVCIAFCVFFLIVNLLSAEDSEELKNLSRSLFFAFLVSAIISGAMLFFEPYRPQLTAWWELEV